MSNNLKHRDSRRLRVDKLNEIVETLNSIIAALQSTDSDVTDRLELVEDDLLGLQILWDNQRHFMPVTSLSPMLSSGVVQIPSAGFPTPYRGLFTGESFYPGKTPWPVKGYKEYTCILNQSGTNDPSATILCDDLGLDDSWERVSEGLYRIEAFANDQTSKIFLSNRLLYYHFDDGGISVNAFLHYNSSANVTYVYVHSVDNGGNNWEGLSNVHLSFRMYPPSYV